MFKKMVVGFLFDRNRRCVLLIKKNRPDWQKGYLNGVGGHVEPGEDMFEAMKREFLEEVGVETDGWKHTVRWLGKDWLVDFFYLIDGEAFERATTMTDEEIVRVGIEKWNGSWLLPNLRWMIPFQLEDEIQFPVTLQGL